MTTPDGGRIPLSQLAAISVEDGASIITRRENRRQISVRTNIRGRDQGSFVAEAQRRIAAEISLPPGTGSSGEASSRTCPGPPGA